MESIADLTAASTAAATTASNRSEELGREDFLLMLIAQLENQDPLNPQDATEFTAQLAQFTSLDQLIQMRTAIDKLAGVQNDAQSLAAADLIGREALVEGGNFGVSELDGAPLPTLFVGLETPTELLGADIRDATGRVVASTGALGTLPAGRTALDWSDFDRVPGPGTYTLAVTPISGAATPELLVQARVTGAAVSGGSPMILLNGANAPLSSLIEVRE